MSDELNSLPEYKFIEGEPWCGLRTGKDLKAWGKSEEIAWNQVHRQNEKYKFYIKAFDLLTENNIKGDYFEFGCHRVRTFRMALTEARHHNLKEMNFFAFDSFASFKAFIIFSEFPDDDIAIIMSDSVKVSRN